MKIVYGSLLAVFLTTSASAQNVIQQDTFFGDNVVQQNTVVNRPARTVRKVTKVVRKNVYNTYNTNNTYVEERVVAPAPAPVTQVIIQQAPPEVVVVRPQPSVTTVYNPSPYYSNGY